MKHTNCYYVKYIMNRWETERGICLLASSKADAYDKAVYESIPDKEGHPPYSAWVSSVTYQNGTVREFNTCGGNPC